MKTIPVFECSDGQLIKDKVEAERHELACQLFKRSGTIIRQVYNQAKGIKTPAHDACTKEEIEEFLLFVELLEPIVRACKRKNSGLCIRKTA